MGDGGFAVVICDGRVFKEDVGGGVADEVEVVGNWELGIGNCGEVAVGFDDLEGAFEI